MSDTIIIDGYELTDFQFKELKQFGINDIKLYDVFAEYLKNEDIKPVQDYFINHKLIINEEKNKIKIYLNKENVYTAIIPIEK